MADIERAQIRCLLVGSSAVGKSTFIRKLTNNSVSPDYTMTSRVAVHRKSYLPTNSRLQVEVSFLDCPGKELYQQLVEDICKQAGAKCFVVAIFDVTNRASIAPVESLITWLSKQQQNGGGNQGKTAEPSGILLGNKIDLHDKRIVSSSEGMAKAKMLKLRYFECSALNDVDIQDFDQLLIDMVQTSMAPPSDIERSGPNQPTMAVKALDAN